MSFLPRLHQSSRRCQSFLSAAVAALLFGAAFPIGCGNDPTVGDGDTASGGICKSDDDCGSGKFCREGECLSSCATCGLSCEATRDCPDGQFCSSSGTCQKECSSDDDCDESQTCNPDGRCIARNDIEVNVGGGGGGRGDSGNEECIDVKVEFEPIIPNVVLLIDQSGSMIHDTRIQEAIDDGSYVPWDCPDSPNSNQGGWDNDNNEDNDASWRWNVVRNVLLNPDSGIVKPLEDKVRFGLVTYSSQDGFGPDETPRTCPMLTEVDIAFGNHQAMLDSFECSDLVGDTPTRESLTAAAEELAAADLEGPKVIVLATDGEPDTCECANWNGGGGRDAAVCDTGQAPQMEYEGQMYRVDQYEQILVALEAKRIYEELGIRVEVINVGAASLKTHLDSVAAYGGAVSGASIDGTNPGALTDAFQTIIDGVRSCVIDLDGEISKGKEDTGTVTLNGEELELNGEDGWIVLNPSQIELVGEACETVKSGDHDIDVSFPCDSFEIITR